MPWLDLDTENPAMYLEDVPVLTLLRVLRAVADELERRQKYPLRRVEEPTA